MRRISIALIAATAVAATTLAAAVDANADPAAGRGHREWGYYSAEHGGWGLGGVAAAPLVGGAIIPVTPYGPNPYGPYPHGMYPYPYTSYRY